ADEKWRWLPFFEAYFSNFIEGTQFGVEEAREIAVEGLVPPNRPKDAHDVSASYRLAVDPDEARRVPNSADELIGILEERHSVLMAARPERRPGAFKDRPNYAGGYRFVDPELIDGTLRQGFDVLSALVDPFARAVAMMLLVTECHPFDDGNGRIARLAANSELSAAGQVRFVIPTAFRNNYLAGLTAISNGAGRGESLIAVLDFAQRWTAAVQWQTFEVADADITASNGYLDPAEAEASGRRLRLPAGPGDPQFRG
ncbi:MAG: Fic family protein, partial [Mycobacteriales bacterium]